MRLHQGCRAPQAGLLSQRPVWNLLSHLGATDTENVCVRLAQLPGEGRARAEPPEEPGTKGFPRPP